MKESANVIVIHEPGLPPGLGVGGGPPTSSPQFAQTNRHGQGHSRRREGQDRRHHCQASEREVEPAHEILFAFWTIVAVLSMLLVVGLLVLVYEAIGALRLYNLQHGESPNLIHPHRIA
jgi:hypothetical protein